MSVKRLLAARDGGVEVPMMHDLVVRGGLVADGDGAPARRADVAVDGDRITAVEPGLNGARVLDATGCIVAPGFIDIHTHYDAQVFWDPALTPSSFHGVTTVVAGNCGFSIAPTRPSHRDLIARTLENVEDMNVATLEAGIPWDFETFPEYLASVARHGTVLNFAAYIGHTALRLFVMGEDAYHRLATPTEVTGMQAALAEAIDAGAAGLATSFLLNHRGADGLPVPSRLADREELVALLDVMAAKRRGVVSVAPGGWCDFDELYVLQPLAGVPFTYGALLSLATGGHRRQVALNEAGWRAGAEVWPQVSPRPLAFSIPMTDPFTLNFNSVFAELMPLDLEARRTAYADESWRRRATAEFAAVDPVFAPRWGAHTVAESSAHPELIGRRLTDIAAERGVEPFDALLDLTLDEPDLGLRIHSVLANDDVDEVTSLITLEHCTLGLSDAGAHVGQICDASQATDLLGNWVRERKVLTVELAVRRLSGLQADILGLPDRGYLRPGAAADVVVFDPATVAPGPTRRVRDFPGNADRLTAPEPVGIRHVLVNGDPIRTDGEPDPACAVRKPGRVLRPAPRGPVAAAPARPR
jgi:N-acyl-D-aspartate/D-glutamate deacylase